jgi:hypothetical protein
MTREAKIALGFGLLLALLITGLVKTFVYLQMLEVHMKQMRETYYIPAYPWNRPRMPCQ